MFNKTILILSLVAFFIIEPAMAQQQVLQAQMANKSNSYYSTEGEIGFLSNHRPGASDSESFDIESFILGTKIRVQPTLVFDSQIEFYKNDEGSSDFKLKKAEFSKQFSLLQVNAGVLFPRVGYYHEDLRLFYSTPITYSEFEMDQALPGMGLLFKTAHDGFGLRFQSFYKTVTDPITDEKLNAQYTPYAVSNWWKIGFGQLNLNYYQNQLANDQYVQSQGIGFFYLIPMGSASLALKYENWDSTLYEDKGLSQKYSDTILNPVLQFNAIGVSYLKLDRKSQVAGIHQELNPERQETIQVFYNFNRNLRLSVEQNKHLQVGKVEKSLKSETTLRMSFQL